MSNRSVKVAVRLDNGETVEGWDYGETRLGYYVALDPAGASIRFVPATTYQSLSWDHEAEHAKFPEDAGIDQKLLAERIHEFDKRLRRPLETIDYNQVRRLASRLRHLRSTFDHPRPRARLHDIMATYDAHIALFEQIRTSGLEEALLKEDEFLRSSLSKHILLAAEADIVQITELETMIATARLPERPEQSKILSMVTPALIETYIQTPDKGHADATEQSNAWSRRLKIISATGKLALGGLFASANLGLGVFAGVVSALPTLTMGTVSAAVGVAASTYTGLNTSLDALKDMAALIKEPDKD